MKTTCGNRENKRHAPIEAAGKFAMKVENARGRSHKEYCRHVHSRQSTIYNHIQTNSAYLMGILHAEGRMKKK